MSKKWLEAVARYDSARIPKSDESPSIPTLREFMESVEGKSARTLLEAARESIVIATYAGKYCHLVLAGSGLKIHEGDHVKPISTDDAAKILKVIHKHEPDYEPVVQIRKQLDEIADNAP